MINHCGKPFSLSLQKHMPWVIINLSILHSLGLQTQWFRIGTISDPYPDPDLDMFLNRGFGSGFDLEPILLVADLIPIEKRSSYSGSKKTGI